MRRLLVGAVVASVLVAFLAKLEIDVDVFNLLPEDSLPVQGLRTYQDHFGASRDLVISLSASGEEDLLAAAHSLSEVLTEESLAEKVVWRNPVGAEVGELGSVLAYQWVNQSPDLFRAMTQRFTPGSLEQHLSETVERISTSFRPDEIGRLTRDPFSLTDFGPARKTHALAEGDDPFSSKDGLFRIMIVTAPPARDGYSGYRLWLDQVTEAVTRWKLSESRQLDVKMSGNPAFVVEIGTGMSRDLGLAALGTLTLVSLLFWLVYRRLRPLVWLAATLLFSTAAALVAVHLATPPVFAVSLAFAVLLIGLATDYGLIIYQEKTLSPGITLEEQRKRVSPSVLWAAATTACAFLMLSFSSLPGVRQLGVLVAIGVVVASLAMLWVFMPASGMASKSGANSGRLIHRLAPPSGVCVGLTVLLAIAAASSLTWKSPVVDSDSKGLGPRESQVRDARSEVLERIERFGVKHWVLLEGDHDRELKSKLAELDRLLGDGVEQGLLDGYDSVEALWPDGAAQARNLAQLKDTVARWPDVKVTAREYGFGEESLELTAATFDAWRRFAQQDRVDFPGGPFYQWLQSQYRAASDEGVKALVPVQVAAESDVELLARFSKTLETADIGRLIGWNLLANSLVEYFRRDLVRVLLPTGLVLLVMLLLTFKGLREAWWSLFTLLFTVTLLAASMVLLDWSWNLINVMSLPLLLGAGVDYSIHIQLGLKRFNGDVRQVRAHIGPAILLCGVSTAIAFGSLSFAGNAGLASLGRVTALGVLIASLVSVFLLPVWWKLSSPKS